MNKLSMQSQKQSLVIIAVKRFTHTKECYLKLKHTSQARNVRNGVSNGQKWAR